MTELGKLIGEALDAGDLKGGLDLLQQQAALLQQVAADAIAAVNKWARGRDRGDEQGRGRDGRRTSTRTGTPSSIGSIPSPTTWIAGIERTRDGYVAFREAEIEAIEAAAKARIEALEAEIEAIQDAAEAAQDRIADQIEALQDQADAQIEALEEQGKALQEQIQATKEWEQVVKSVGDYLMQLTISADSPR